MYPLMMFMVYVEKKKIRNREFYYHTKSIRLGNKIKKYRRYIGKDKKTAYSKEEIINSVNQFLNNEYDTIKDHYKLEKVTYSESAIKDIIKENSIINALSEFNPETKKKMDFEFAIEFIYNSNNIEGSKLPINEVRNIMSGKKSKYKDRNEILEAQNSIKAYEYIDKDFKFNMKSILKLHAILTKDLTDHYGKPYTQGFKDAENVVGKFNFKTTHPSNVKKELKELIDWYKFNKKKKFTPELAFRFYFQFEQIHPFMDGNGRTGRLIMNKILKENNFNPMIIYNKNVDAHLNAFAKGRTQSTKFFSDFMFKRYRANYTEFYKNFFTK
jgi:fido (protein-threonine AMPylation protein)